MSVKKGLYIKTYGCQMNVYDSDKMADLMAPHGYQVVETPDMADIVILNTCHIREKAAEKVFSELGRLRPLKNNRRAVGGEMILAVAGCVAQAEGEEIIRRAPYVDMVFGPQTYHSLPEMVEKANRAIRAAANDETFRGAHIVNTDFPVESKFDTLPQTPLNQNFSTFLTIQEGCDKFCTFCCVPYTRGAEYSRPAADIIKEAKELVAQGALEINLLGQNVNAFHGVAPQGKGEWGLGRLIRELAEIDGLERIRYTTSHPRDMKDELIEAHRDVEKLVPYLHLPIQSGSDRILTAMNRKHSADAYRELVAKFREARPDIGITSDFIVGFPGETDQDFAETLRLVRDVTYCQAYSFKYSPRPGTPASVHETQVPEEVKTERLAMLQQLLGEQQYAFNQSKVGQVLPLLIQRSGKKEGQLIGQSAYVQPVYVDGDQSLVGKIVSAKITRAAPNSLDGELC